MTEPEWMSEFDKPRIREPFGGGLKAIKVSEDEIDDDLLTNCVEKYIVTEVSKGYFVTHTDIETHLEVIQEHGIEAYLEKRLELVDDE